MLSVLEKQGELLLCRFVCYFRKVIQGENRQVVMHTLVENIVSKARSEVDGVMTTVEFRIQDAVLTAIDNLVIPRVELAMKSTNASPRRSVDCNVLGSDQRDSSGNVEGLQMTA